jgi:hypothetical protein
VTVAFGSVWSINIFHIFLIVSINIVTIHGGASVHALRRHLFGPSAPHKHGIAFVKKSLY